MNSFNKDAVLMTSSTVGDVVVINTDAALGASAAALAECSVVRMLNANCNNSKRISYGDFADPFISTPHLVIKNNYTTIYEANQNIRRSPGLYWFLYIVSTCPRLPSRL